ncbi:MULTISPECIES: hypothetical protein [unclassified Streptomyces]|uniref:hypothetical protein n=1 Tax=unclassified Streptomyces TaxID=2593676 RepID=UPI00117BE0D3|nr:MULTISPECIES: hypothetical protein [unclassified Streptomyces]
MTKRAFPAFVASGFVLCALVLVGCSGDSEAEKKTSSSTSLQVCGQFLGVENVRRAVDSVGGGESSATARQAPGRLAVVLNREAEQWSVDDLLHNSYSACRIDIPAEGGGASVIEARVAWSVLTVDSMGEPKYAKRWRQLNEEVFVELETGQPSMRLLVACGVPGATSEQEAGLPLQMTVSDPGLAVEQRQALLSTFARTLVGELACAGDPVVPEQLIR